jgi:FG-GAP-like repeat/FG-GAP repeat/Planctomycete extracellular
MIRRMPRLSLRTAAKTSRRLRIESLEDRTVPSFTVAKSFPVGPGGGAGFKPVAVAVGDFNGDGKLDAVSANQDGHNSIGLLRGNGDGKFQPADTFDVGAQPAFVQAADMNTDGFLDIVTANKADNSVSVLLGNGDGTFQAAAKYAVGASTGPVALAIADFDEDGHLDLAVADNGASTVTLMLGDGAGGFAPAAQTVAVGSNPTSVAVADFNGDGKPDIASVSGGFGHLNINLNTGGGTFGPTANFETGFCANGVTTGDFNHDGKADVAVACVFPSSDGVSILIGNGDGTFVTHPNPPGGPIPFVSYNAGNQTPGYITTGDMDGDGNTDLVTANFSSTIQFANNSITLLPGKPDGTFGPARVYHGGPGPLGVAVGDFNGDGKQDVVTADAGESAGTVSMLIGRGDGTLKAAEALAVTVRNSASTDGIVTADFTSDGIADLAVVTWNVNYNGMTLFPGRGDGQFLPGIQSPAVSATSVADGDFNKDGKLDLAVTGSSGVSILLGNGNGTFGAPTTFAAGSLPSWVAVADFNGDDKLDLAVANGSGSDGVSVLLGNGAGGFGSATSVPAGGASAHLVAADLNGDGKADLAVVNSGDLSFVLGNGNGTFGAPTTFDAGGGPGGVSVGDFNGDGALDLACPSFIPPGGGGSAVLVWLNNGAGTFGTMSKYVVGSNPIGSVVADFNQDGFLDVVAVNDFADTVSLLAGAGDGTFQTQQTFVVGDRPTWVVAQDFTGDGRPDMAVVNSNSGSVTIVHTPEPATHFRFDAASTGTAGSTVQVTVTALDTTGSIVPDYVGTVSFGSDDLQADLPPNYTFTLADEGTRTFDVVLKTAGTHDVTMTGEFGTLAASIQVNAAAADHLEFDAPTGATAGTPFDVTVRAIDPFDNLATGFTGTVQFTSTDPNVAAGHPGDYTFTDTDAGVHTFSGGFALLTAGTQSVSVTSLDLPTLSASVSVSPTAASKLMIATSSTAQAGTPIDVTVTAYDPYDNLATGFAGLVHFDSTDLIADKPGDYSFVGSDQGAHTFQVTLKRAGLQSVSVSSAGLTGAQTAGIQVSASAAAKLVFVNAIANTFPNLAIPAPVTLQVNDQFDNPVPGGPQVTLSLASNPTKAKFKGILSASPDASGIVTFSNLVVTKPGTYTLAATSAGGIPPASGQFTVYSVTHFKVKVTSPVAKPTAGDVVQVTVTALDGHNKPDLSYRGTVHFTSTDAKAVLPADYLFTAGDNGQHTFDVTLKTAGSDRITVNDMVKVKLKSQVAVTVLAGAATQFAITKFPLSAKVNSTYAFTVTALDQFGNRATGYVGTVTITSNGSATISGAGPTAPAPATYVFTAGNKGQHAFKAKFTAPGTGLSLTVTDHAITGTETGITVV